MAADRATVSVSASLLPDEIKTSVGGTTIYDIDDLGDTNKWAYSLTIVGNANEDALLASVPFLGQGTAEEGATASANSADDVVFLFIKHTGTTNGSTASTDKLFLNLSGGNPEGGGAVGDIVINPNNNGNPSIITQNTTIPVNQMSYWTVGSGIPGTYISPLTSQQNLTSETGIQIGVQMGVIYDGIYIDGEEISPDTWIAPATSNF